MVNPALSICQKAVRDRFGPKKPKAGASRAESTGWGFEEGTASPSPPAMGFGGAL